jgi:hypothetical protein
MNVLCCTREMDTDLRAAWKEVGSREKLISTVGFFFIARGGDPVINIIL